MVSTSPKSSTSHGHPMSFTSHPWPPPPPWMGSSFTHLMHGTSITCRSFSTSLENHRNKPHLTWSPDAPGIISNVFTPELFVVLADGPSFFEDYPLVSVFIPGGLFAEFVGCPPNSRTVRCVIAAQLKFVKFIEDAFELQKW
jgi:hypothetical protein